MSLRGLKPHFTDAQIAGYSEEQLIVIYNGMYLNDFVTNEFEVGGKKIKIADHPSRIPGFEKYHETFSHIVTRESQSRKERFFEINRANRIHWVKKILLGHPCGDIQYFKWKDERGICKEYFWYFSGKFMVVLKDVSEKLQVVTAFCVDDEEKVKYYEWFKAYEEGRSDCK